MTDENKEVLEQDDTQGLLDTLGKDVIPEPEDEEPQEPEETEPAKEEPEEEPDDEPENEDFTEKIKTLIRKDVDSLTKEEIKFLQKNSSGLYHSGRQEREKRQKLEERLTHLEIKEKARELNKKDDKKELPEEFTEPDPLAEVADDEIPTAKQIRAHDEWVSKRNAFYRDKEKSNQSTLSKKQDIIRERAEKVEKIFKESHPDYDEKFAIFEKAIQTKQFKYLLAGMYQEASKDDGNPAEYVYEVGKMLAPILGEKKEEKKPAIDADRIIKNAGKKKTSAGSSSASDTKTDWDALDDDALLVELSKLNEFEFARVPKSVQDRALKL